jgi:Zn-dependent M28 family amino/carboxypeptidase
MINMDMIGRMRDGRVIVGGSSSGEGLKRLVERTSKRFQISLDTDEKAVYGSSDHTAFKARSVPVLFFFTGLHGDYHRPSDTLDKIEQENTAELLQMIAATTEQLRTQKERPAFVRLQRGSPPSGGGSAYSNKFTHNTRLTGR